MSEAAAKRWRPWWLLLLPAPPVIAALVVPPGYLIGEWLWGILPMPWAELAEFGMLFLPGWCAGAVAIGLIALLHSRGSRTVFVIICAIEAIASFYVMSYPFSFYFKGWK